MSQPGTESTSWFASVRCGRSTTVPVKDSILIDYPSCHRIRWRMGELGRDARARSFVVTAFMRSLGETRTKNDPMNRVTTNDKRRDARLE